MKTIPGLIRYLCGSCLHADKSDEHGNCKSCGADNWVERRDFEHNKDVIIKVAKEQGLTIEQLKFYFWPRVCVNCRHGDREIKEEPCKKCLDMDMRARPLFTSKFRKRRTKK